MLRILSITLIFLVSGCAAPNIDSSYEMSEARTTGVITGSITYDGVYGAYRLHLVERDTGKEYRVEHGSSQTLNLFLAFKGEDPHPALSMNGSPFAVELPVGTYAVRGWQVSSGAANINSPLPVAVTFTVKPQQAIYLGNFHFHEISRIGRLPTRASVTLSERKDRDLPAIKAAFPALGNVQLTQSIATGTRIEDLGGSSSAKITPPIIIPVAR